MIWRLISELRRLLTKLWQLLTKLRLLLSKLWWVLSKLRRLLSKLWWLGLIELWRLRLVWTLIKLRSSLVHPRLTKLRTWLIKLWWLRRWTELIRRLIWLIKLWSLTGIKLLRLTLTKLRRTWLSHTRWPHSWTWSHHSCVLFIILAWSWTHGHLLELLIEIGIVWVLHSCAVVCWRSRAVQRANRFG